MKRIIVLITAALLVFSMSACNTAESPKQGSSESGQAQTGQPVQIENKVDLSLDKASYEPEERIEVTLATEKLNKDNAVIVIVPSSMKHGEATPAQDSCNEFRYLSDFSEIPFYMWAPKTAGQYDVRVYSAEENGEELASINVFVGKAETAKTDGSGKINSGDFSWPEDEFFTSAVRYSGAGEITYTSVIDLDGQKAYSVYFNNSTLNDSLAYASQLKNEGVAYQALAGEAEPTDVTDSGFLTWRGCNDDMSLNIVFTYYDETQELDTLNNGTIAFNLYVQISNHNLYL